MTGDLRRWLDGREPVPPAALRSRLAESLEEEGPGAVEAAGSLAGLLAEVALRRLERARTRPAERAAAFDLLVADACLTYACEAVVDPERPAGEARGGESEEAGMADPEDGLRDLLRRVAGRTA